MASDNEIQAWFFALLTVFLLATIQQMRMSSKKKHVQDLDVWQKYNRWQFIYQLIAMPTAVASGVLMSKVLPIWFGA